jgi:thymidylate synthase ThyX
MTNNNSGTTLIVPAFMHCKEMKLNMVNWNLAINRLPEAKNVVPAMYSDLESDFQAAWRESKTNAIIVGDGIRKAKQNIAEIKSDIILVDIPEALKELPKSANNADFRSAIMHKNQEYKDAMEHLGKLEAMLEHFESHMKTLENTSRFLKKQMDYIVRNGSSY